MEFKAVVLKDINKLSYEKIKFESLQPDYALIEVKASGCSPYDFYFIDGRNKVDFANRTVVIGFEGSGIVRQVGSNVSNDLIGKRVNFIVKYDDTNSIGSWSEYAVTDKNNILLLNENITDNQAAYALGNPFTVICLFKELITGKHESIILDAASSAIGRMIIRECVKQNINIISIVRKEDNISILEKEGSKNNFCSTSSKFYQDIKSAIETHKPSIYLTFLGGGIQSTLFNYMKKGSTLCSLGNLNNDVMFNFTTYDFIFRQKKIIGWNLYVYLETISEEESLVLRKKCLEELSKKDNSYSTEISKEFTYDNFEDGLKYYKENMSKGKIVFKNKI